MDFGGEFRSGPGWLVPMEKKKLTKDYDKLYKQVVMDGLMFFLQACLKMVV